MSDESPAASEQGQVSSVSTDLSVKHPLHNKWVMWWNGPSKGKGNNDWLPKEVFELTCVEDFWRLYNNMLEPSQLPNGSGYHFFKKGVQPVWEDTENRKGGKWVAQYKTNSPKREEKNENWLNLLLALIGENFDEADDITGAVYSPRKFGDKIAVWTKSSDNKEVQESVGKQFKAAIRFPLAVKYEAHGDSKQGSYTAKARYKITNAMTDDASPAPLSPTESSISRFPSGSNSTSSSSSNSESSSSSSSSSPSSSQSSSFASFSLSTHDTTSFISSRTAHSSLSSSSSSSSPSLPFFSLASPSSSQC